MQKKLIATTIASLLAGQAMALEVFNNDTSSLTIGGRIGLMVNDDDQIITDDSSRTNLRFSHKLSNNLTAVALQEWGVNTTAKGDDDLLSNRLGYIRLDHSNAGMLSVGKQYSAYAEIADWGSDMMLFNGGEGVGIYDGLGDGDGGVHGTGRADGAIGYRNSFGGLNIGLQYQLKDNEGTAADRQWSRKSGQQVAVSYDLPAGFSLGYAYNQTRFNKTQNHNGDTAKAHIFGAKYNADALYVGINYADMKNHANTRNQAGEDANGIAKKASTIDLYASYALDQVADGFSVYGGYQQMDYSKGADGNSSKEEMKMASVGVQYEIGPVLFGAQYDKKDNKDSDGKKVKTDNILSFNARYYF